MDLLGGTTADVALQCYRALADAVDEGVYQLDEEGRFVAIDDVFVECTGYDREDLLGEHLSIVVDDADVERIERDVRDCLEADDGALAPREVTVETAAGERTPSEVRVSLLRHDGEFRGTVGVIGDVPDRTERATRSERELLDRVFEASPVGISALTPDGEIVTLNERAADMVGTGPEEVTGTRYEGPDWDVYDAEGEPVPPEERTFARVIETGEPVTDFETRVERADGSRVWLSVNGVPVFDSADELSLVILSYEDVTELKDRERQLLREHSQTEKLLQTAPIAFSVQDASGETLLANRRAQDLLGLSEREFIDEPTDAEEWYVYDDDGELLEPDAYPSARVLRTGEPIYDEELEIERPDGDRLWVSVNVAPTFDSDGSIERIVSAGEDITERKERERRIARRRDELETELGEILGRISDAFYALDEELRFTHLNEHAETVLRHAEDELLGRSVWEVFPDAVDGVFWEQFHAAMDTQEPVTFEFHVEELGAWLEFNAYPSETGLSVYFRDVSDRVERERELERYETIVETVNDGIYTVDPDGRFTMVNETYAEMTGHSTEELLGSDVSLVIDDHVAETARTLERELIAGERDTVVLEATIRTADGEAVPAEATFALLPGEGTEYERVCVVRDVTERKRAETELRESEERFRNLMEQSPFSMQVFDADGRTIAANSAWERLWNAPREELEDYNVLEDEQLEADGLISYIRDAFAGEVVELPVTHYDPAEIGKPGRDRWIEGYVYPLLPGDEETFEVALVHHDVTDRVEREKELERHERAVKTVWDGITILDSDERFVLVNDAFCELTGYDREEVLGEHATLVLDESTYEQAGELHDEVVDGDNDIATLEYDLLTSGNETVPVEARFGPVEYADGTVGGAGVIRDIGERRKRERELERALDLLEKTEHIADVGGWEIDVGTQEVFWTDNFFDLLGVPSDEEPSLDEALDVYRQDDRPTVENAIDEALDAGEPFDVEVQFRTDGGEARWLRIQGAPDVVDGDVVSLRGAAQDVTEHKRRERRLEELIDRLEESNRRLEQFAYAASHDLQEPLRMVTSYLTLIDQRYSDVLDEDGEEFLAFAVDGADRMRAMIRGLLHYSQVDNRGDPLEPIELGDVVADVRDDLRMKIDENGAEIAVGELPLVRGDREQLRRVFQNLLDNAIEYSGDEPPRIDIRAERVADAWVCHVADDGIGMDPAHADRIFEVFQRLHANDDHSGAGIGLALCERIVERHGGEIWVESAPGEGATFSFSIPVSGNE